jgi:two-component system CitB family response regulator
MIRTLIVDDDFMVAEIHRGYTERVEGFRVVGVAHSGQAALHEVQRSRPDLLVLDVYLPDQSGLDVLRTLRQQRAPVDVIMVTAAKDVATLQEAMQGGVLHYIVKPFDFARFQQTLQGYRRFREERSLREQVGQADVDRLFQLAAPPSGTDLPKGLDRRTLDLVVGYLAGQREPRSAQQVAQAIGISRATARRYLEFLERTGQALVERRYGTTGRPEHLYRA